MINEHEQAVLTTDLPGHGLQAGDVGVVVHIYNNGAGYEIEFFTLDGETLDVVTVVANQIRPVNRRDMIHVRALTESA